MNTFPYGGHPIKACRYQLLMVLPATEEDCLNVADDLVAAEVWDIIKTCWQWNPAVRPSAHELFSSLNSVERKHSSLVEESTATSTQLRPSMQT
ncbi:hypothetical protein BDV93DRAFT_555252 [Ceratobasidium sp. AG-I]|nr:hypothetical protein BDV93DRAFT_555252 [Ceratobasidium sp. AG-I]